ncbi:MAG: hypothetical protein V2B18_17760 [Pseudomonadota bacterium]
MSDQAIPQVVGSGEAVSEAEGATEAVSTRPGGDGDEPVQELERPGPFFFIHTGSNRRWWWTEAELMHERGAFPS